MSPIEAAQAAKFNRTATQSVDDTLKGTSGNPGWVSRGSSKKIAHSLLHNELRICNFLQG
jgi:hypothetical protein